MKSLSLLSLPVACFLAGCGPSPISTSHDNLVVATTTMVGDLVRVVGGDAVSVEVLMRPGVDPHLYQATPPDVAKLNGAQVIFYNGLFLEGRMTDRLARLSRGGKRVYAVAEAIAPKDGLQPEGSKGHPDPHIWGDASLWAHAVAHVVEGLSAAFPEESAGFKERGDAYKQTLGQWHEWAKDRLATIPEGRRKLVTSHDAFAYFGRAYDIEVVGVQGISTASEPSLADRTRMVDFIKRHRIPAVFVESSVNKTLIERISRDAGVKIGGELFSDAMGEPGDMETVNGETYDLGTYIGMLRHNVNTVVEALK